MTVSVLLVDPSDIARSGCRSLLLEDDRFRLIGDIARAADIGRNKGEAPDLIVFDPMENGELDEEQLAIAIRAAPPPTGLLLLTDCLQKELLSRVLKSGVRGYLIKGRTPSWLFLAAAHIIGSSAGVVIDGALLDRSEALPRPGVAARQPELEGAADLSWRQREVLTLLANGLSDNEVALKLGVARTTIHTHISSIMRKALVLNRVQLGMYAVQAGLVENEPKLTPRSTDMRKAA